MSEEKKSEEKKCERGTPGCSGRGDKHGCFPFAKGRPEPVRERWPASEVHVQHLRHDPCSASPRRPCRCCRERQAKAQVALDCLRENDCRKAEAEARTTSGMTIDGPDGPEPAHLAFVSPAYHLDVVKVLEKERKAAARTKKRLEAELERFRSSLEAVYSEARDLRDELAARRIEHGAGRLSAILDYVSAPLGEGIYAKKQARKR